MTDLHAPDETYLQEMCTFYGPAEGLPTEAVGPLAITADGAVWAGTQYGLARFTGERWEAVPGDHQSTLPVSTLWADGADLWIASSCGVGRLSAGQWRHWWWEEGAPTRHVRQVVRGRDGAVWALTGLWRDPRTSPDPLELWRLVGDRWDAFAKGDRPAVLSLAAGAAGVFAVCPDRLLKLDTAAGPQPFPVSLPPALAGAVFACAACAPDGTLALGTDKGVLLLRPDGSQAALRGEQGLPAEQVTGLAYAPDGTLWVADAYGLASQEQGKWWYWPATRWMPAAPGAVEIAPDGSVWVATARGISHLERRPMTLAEKAAWFDHRMETRNHRLGYYCLVMQPFPDREEPYVHEVTDNDGQHTGMMLAAQCFRYAVTGRDADLALCRRSFEALEWLERVTGRPGFIARCAMRADEHQYPSGGEWHHSTVDPAWYWKGDTSSDEVDGHLFGYAIFHDLMPDPADRARCAALVDRIVRGIIRDDFYLLDTDGHPTLWAMWNPDYLNSPDGRAQKKLNSLELLNYCKIAHRLTGDDFFQQTYRDLIDRHGYLQAVTEVTVAVPPGGQPQFDDLLTFLTYYNLCRCEDDPELRAAYLAGLEASWEYQRVEGNPFFNMVYGALTGRPCDLERGVETLRRVPLDQHRRGVHNSHRADLQYMQGARGRVPVPLPWNEQPLGDWETDPFTLDRAGDGRIEAYTHWWLLAYWLGRYHGLIG